MMSSFLEQLTQCNPAEDYITIQKLYQDFQGAVGNTIRIPRLIHELSVLLRRDVKHAIESSKTEFLMTLVRFVPLLFNTKSDSPAAAFETFPDNLSTILNSLANFVTYTRDAKVITVILHTLQSIFADLLENRIIDQNHGESRFPEQIIVIIRSVLSTLFNCLMNVTKTQETNQTTRVELSLEAIKTISSLLDIVPSYFVNDADRTNALIIPLLPFLLGMHPSMNNITNANGIAIVNEIRHCCCELFTKYVQITFKEWKHNCVSNIEYLVTTPKIINSVTGTHLYLISTAKKVSDANETMQTRLDLIRVLGILAYLMAYQSTTQRQNNVHISTIKAFMNVTKDICSRTKSYQIQAEVFRQWKWMIFSQMYIQKYAPTGADVSFWLAAFQVSFFCCLKIIADCRVCTKRNACKYNTQHIYLIVSI